MEMGYHCFAHMELDDDLKALRETVEYRVLTDTWKKKHDADNKEPIGEAVPDEAPVPIEMETTEVPFKKDGSMMKIACTINDLPLHFIFDTGASDVTLSMVEATFMVKNGYLSDSDVIGNQRYMDANGNVTVGTVVNLKNVVFGEMTLNNVRASVVRNQKAPLLLGQSVLGRLGKVEIDNTHQVLKITLTQDF